MKDDHVVNALQPMPDMLGLANNWQTCPWNHANLCICCKLCDGPIFPNNDKHLARVCLSRARESSRTRRSASSWVEAAYSWSSRASPVSRAASEQLVSCKTSLKVDEGLVKTKSQSGRPGLRVLETVGAQTSWTLSHQTCTT